VSFQASSSGIPISIILVTTSVKLTALIAASPSAAATVSDPCSPLIIASNAEASSTTSVLGGFGSPITDQGFGQFFASRIVLAHQSLHPLDPMADGGNSQFVIGGGQDDVVADLQPQ